MNVKNRLKAFLMCIACIPVITAGFAIIFIGLLILPFVALVKPSVILDRSSKPDEKDELKRLLTETWHLMGRAGIIFGKENDNEYYDAWSKYRELEKECEPFLLSIF